MWYHDRLRKWYVRQRSRVCKRIPATCPKQNRDSVFVYDPTRYTNLEPPRRWLDRRSRAACSCTVFIVAVAAEAHGNETPPRRSDARVTTAYVSSELGFSTQLHFSWETAVCNSQKRSCSWLPLFKKKKKKVTQTFIHVKKKKKLPHVWCVVSFLRLLLLPFLLFTTRWRPMPHNLQIQQQQRQCDVVLYRSLFWVTTTNIWSRTSKDPAGNIGYVFLFFTCLFRLQLARYW